MKSDELGRILGIGFYQFLEQDDDNYFFTVRVTIQSLNTRGTKHKLEQTWSRI